MRKALFRAMLLVVALVATIQSSLMAQNIKTYKGALCKPNTMICALDVGVFSEVSYEYYENENYARVWHGRFTALYSRYYDDHSVVGCYEHGVQSGVWKESGVFYDKHGYLSYNFLNGKLHGDYHFESNDLVISAMFCDNHLSGSISVVGQNGKFSLSGQFDEDGFACGEWEVKYLDYNRIPFIREYVYDKGQVLSIVEIDDSTGERTTYSDQNGEDRRLLSYSGLDSWFSYKMPLYDLLSRRFVNPFKKASYNDATATVNQRALFSPIAETYDEEVIVADGSVGFHTVEEGDIFKDLEKNKDEVASVDADKIAASDDNAVDHVIAQGESFASLAKQYNTTADRIQKLNPDVDPRKILIGQKIRVKGNKPLVKEEKKAEVKAEATPASSGEAVYHTVEAGDTFGHIAVKYETSSKRIQELNPDVDPTRLIIGQKIRVKGNKPLPAEENVLEKEHKADELKTKVRMVALNDNSKPVKRIKVASRLRVDFELTANELAEPGEKTIYVCITDPDGYVLSPASKMIPFTFEGESRAASAMRKVSYENQSVPVSVFYDGEAFEKGTYTVDIFVDGRHCGSGSTYFE